VVRELLQLDRPRLRRADRVLARAADVADLRAAAIARWPAGVRDYVEGGADGEVSLRRNRAGFERHQLQPAVLRDVATVDPATTVLGTPSSLPLVLAPTGYSRMMHTDGERAVAAAARDTGVPYTVATMSTVALEDLPAGGARWFQLYMWRDRGLVEELLARAQAAGCRALVLTVDTAVTGHRLRDTRNGFTLPPRLSPGTLASMARRPAWCWSMLTGEPITFANVPPELTGAGESVMAVAAKQFDASVTWSDLAWLRDRWAGPIVVKGVLDPRDAREAAHHGADGVVVSNHGGRQLDQTVAPIDALPAVRDAVGSDLSVLVDSGIRRGTDIVVALALGADACLLGRPYLYGLGAAGEAGVRKAIEILQTEFAKAMQLLGVTTVEKLRAEGRSLLADPRAGEVAP
jgi:L-lactate dehydrogenase (cytochrome)